MRGPAGHRVKSWPAWHELSQPDIRTTLRTGGTGGCRRFLSGEDDEEAVVRLRRHTRTGRALGSAAFVERMEGLLGLTLRPKKPGPRPRKTGS